MKTINILVVDDHKVFRDGINALLEKVEGVEVVAEASNGKEALDQLKKCRVDVVLMDIDMGEMNGIDTTQIVKQLYPDVNILVLSMHGEHNYIIKMLDAGASGYILKNAGMDEMVSAIKCVSKGDSYFSREVSTVLLLV